MPAETIELTLDGNAWLIRLPLVAAAHLKGGTLPSVDVYLAGGTTGKAFTLTGDEANTFWEAYSSFTKQSAF